MEVIKVMKQKAQGLFVERKKIAFRKGDGVGNMVMGAAIGTLIIIAFFIIVKAGLGIWGESFKELVSM